MRFSGLTFAFVGFHRERRFCSTGDEHVVGYISEVKMDALDPCNGVFGCLLAGCMFILNVHKISIEVMGWVERELNFAPFSAAVAKGGWTI